MHGLYVLWWVRERHVPIATVAVILAAGDVAVSLLEVPTGWLADKYGHRASLITGSLLQIAGMLFGWLGAGVPGVLASSLVIAAGDCFRSGADQALLYRSCAALGDEASFQRIESRSHSLQQVSLVALMLAGGAIVGAWGFHAGWAIETALSAAGLGIAWAMVEPGSPTRPTRPTPTPVSAGSDVSGPFRALTLLIVPAALLNCVASAAAFLVQADVDLDPALMTAMVAALTLAEAAGSWIGGRFTAGARAQIALASIGAGVAAAAWFVPGAFLPAAALLSILIGVAWPMRAAAIQRLAADHVRARAASLASACDKALMAVALTLAGMLPRRRRP